jgi:predicted transposase/invertase (TIGR01784 family)
MANKRQEQSGRGLLARDLLSPKNDYVFKLLFGDRRNLDVLADFLQSVLDLPAEEYDRLELVDPHLKRESRDGKLGVLDVRIHTTRGKIINVEIQVEPFTALRERIVYYASRMFYEQLKKNEAYDRLKKVVSILITDHVLIGENDCFHNRYRLLDRDTGSCFTDILEINTLELPKLPAGVVPGKNRDLVNWLRFLRVGNKEELTMLTQQNPYIAKAMSILAELSANEEVRREAEAREKMRRDIAARQSWLVNQGMEQGREQGRKEGREQGRKEGLAEVAKNLLRQGVSRDVIVTATGLSPEEIEKLSVR